MRNRTWLLSSIVLALFGMTLVATIQLRPVAANSHLNLQEPQTQSEIEPLADDLSGLSDEFNDSSTISNWRRVYQEEQWPANQLERYDINTSVPGMMMMMPYTSTWFQDYRGELAFKLVQGDFVVTTRVQSSRRSGSGAPQSQYSLAGILVRTPRNITPQTWRPGGENYVFLSLGAASTPGRFQFEVKTTANSNTQLIVTDTTGGDAVIQVARIGPYLIMLRKTPDGPWVVHRRYVRSDFPNQLQVGLTCYTDFPTCATFQPFVHNSTVITGGHADLIALYDYVHYQRPIVPSDLTGRNLSDPNAVSDADLLRFLGENLSAATPDFTLTASPAAQTVTAGAAANFTVNVQGANGFSNAVGLSAAVNPPSGNVTVSFSNTSITPGGMANMTVNTAANTTPGSYTVNVTGAFGQQTHNRSVTVNVTSPSNAAPTIAPIADQTVKAGEVRTVTVSASDADGNAGLKLSLISAPSYVALSDNGNGAGTIRMAPSATEIQGGQVTVQVADPGGATAQTSFTVTVQPAPSDTENPIVSNVTLSKKKVARKKDATVGISWRSTDNTSVATHDLVFAADGAAFNTAVVSGLPGTAQQFTWTVPTSVPKTKTGVVKVIAKDAAGNAGEGISSVLTVK